MKTHSCAKLQNVIAFSSLKLAQAISKRNVITLLVLSPTFMREFLQQHATGLDTFPHTNHRSEFLVYSFELLREDCQKAQSPSL